MLGYIRRKYHELTKDEQFSEILNGSAWALAAKLTATGLWIMSSVIIAKFYGAKVLGIVTLIQAFLKLCTILPLLGTNTSILRFIPEHLTKYSPASAFKIYRKTLLLVTLASLAAGGLFFLSSTVIAERIFNKPHLDFYIAIAAVFILFKSLMLLNTSAVRGIKLMRTFAFMKILPQGFNLLLLLSLGVFIASDSVPVYALLVSYALTGITGWAIMEMAFHKRAKPQDSIQSVPTREVLSISLPMLMTAAMNFVIGKTGIIMLGMFRSETEVGYYAIAVHLATLTAYILHAVALVAAPKFSELYHSDKMDELFYVAQRGAKLIFWVATPVALTYVALGKTILHTAFGPEFVAAYPALVLLVMGQFVHSISGATGVFMNMTGHQKVLRNFVFVAASANIGLNLLLTPEYGLYGAATAAMVSLITWNLATLCYIKKKFGRTTGYLPVLVQ